MRGRAIGLGLLAVGAFLLAAALAVRLFLEPALVKYPLDQTASPTADGTDVDFFDLTAAEQLTGLEADVRQEVVGDPGSEAANDDVAVWNFGSTVTSTDDVLLNAGTYRVCIDRREAVAVECDVDHVDYDDDVNVEGLTLTFPFGTEQQDYDVFNSTTKQAWPATYEGTEELDGLEVYRFQLSIPETVIRELDVPAAFFGSAATAPCRRGRLQQRADHLGRARQRRHRHLGGAPGDRPARSGRRGRCRPSSPATSPATSTPSPTAWSGRRTSASQITLVKKTMPLGMALGVLLLIVGAVSTARRARTGAHRVDDPEPVATREVGALQ